MPNHDPQQVILGKRIVQQQREAQEYPGQVWRAEDEQAQERQPNSRVPAGPYVDQREAQRRPEKGHRSDGRQYLHNNNIITPHISPPPPLPPIHEQKKNSHQQRNSGIHNQPGKVGRPPAEAALLQIP